VPWGVTAARNSAAPGSSLASMPVTRNVAWDGRLEAFKGRATREFVALVAAAASACAACGLALRQEEQRSLIVDITEGRNGDGIEFLAFDTCICHQRRREPALTLHTGAADPRVQELRGPAHPWTSGQRRYPGGSDAGLHAGPGPDVP
jgi:hypothetical protein